MGALTQDQQVHPVEYLAFEAMRPDEVIDIAGWLLRHDPNSSIRRRNSVVANKYRPDTARDDQIDQRKNSVLARGFRSHSELDGCIDQVETFYSERGIPPRFHLSRYSKPIELEGRLQHRGYEREEPSWVMTAERFTPPPIIGQVDVNDVSVTAGLRGDASLLLDGVQAAAGTGMVQGDWIGIFGMATETTFRRRGLGRAVLRALLAWGAQNGASHAYLQTKQRNYAAQSLYFLEGFDRAYPYVYMIKRR